MGNWDDSWYDDDQFPPPRTRGGRGGAITVAVVSFVMCAFNALSSACLLFCGLLLGGFGNANNNGRLLPGDLMQNTPLLILGFGLGSLTCFIAQIVAGIGLLGTKRWARTLSFYLAAYSVIVCLYLIYLLFRCLANDFGGADESVIQAVMCFVGLGMHGGYAGTVFIALLNPRVAASFRR